MAKARETSHNLRREPAHRGGNDRALRYPKAFDIICGTFLRRVLGYVPRCGQAPRSGAAVEGNTDKLEEIPMIDKNEIRKQFQRHERDTGSSEVQIATLTKKIEALTEHLKANKKDKSSRYGLIRMVNNRRKLLDYLKRTDEASYRKLIADLSLRR